VRLVGRFRVVVAASAVVLASVMAASAVFAGTRATGATTQEVTITASDGAKLACGLVLPGGNSPAAGWPGLLLFHGLGQTHATMETIANAAFAPAGFASLACDARGTGASGGRFGLDGPREVQDARDLVAWLAARGDVSDTEIGAFGLSLGGGAVWNAAVAGVPFKAIVPAITWTDLARGLAPADVPKAELVSQLALLVPGKWDPSLTQARHDLLAGSVTPAVRTAAAARSARARLHSLDVPTLILQGRHDFLFDLDQALTAYRLLAAPKRLYLGDLGHPPATNPAAEQPRYLGEAVAWFERYLTGVGTVHGGVELAHDPWDGTTSSFKKPPRTRHLTVNLPGTKTLTPTGSLTRSVRLPGGPLETFGDGSLSVRYSGNSGWAEIRGTVSVKGSKTPISVGAAKIGKGSAVAKIPLLDEAVLLPRGKKLVVSVGATSADGVYAASGASGSLTIGRVTLHLSLLKRAISR
jgi:pimeloyl-ACP methyl ester carboxylesterase